MPERTIDVEIAWVSDGAVRVEALRVAQGTTIAGALAAAPAAGIEVDLSATATSVFGVSRPGAYVLRAGDRIELTLGLEVDPKVARQRRVAHRLAQREREAAGGKGRNGRKGRKGPKGPKGE